MRPRHRTLAALLAAATLAAGCASSARTSYTHPSADLGAIRKVAVLPFTSLAADPAAAAKVHRVFLVELLATGVVEVVEPGAVTQVQLAERIESADALAPADLQRIGQALAADGLFLGTVVDFAESRIGTVPAPEVTIQLRLVETASGATVWSSSETRSGAGVRARLLGFGGDSLTAAARKLVREQLDTLVR